MPESCLFSYCSTVSAGNQNMTNFINKMFDTWTNLRMLSKDVIHASRLDSRVLIAKLTCPWFNWIFITISFCLSVCLSLSLSLSVSLSVSLPLSPSLFHVCEYSPLGFCDENHPQSFLRNKRDKKRSFKIKFHLAVSLLVCMICSSRSSCPANDWSSYNRQNECLVVYRQ